MGVLLAHAATCPVSLCRGPKYGHSRVTPLPDEITTSGSSAGSQSESSLYIITLAWLLPHLLPNHFVYLNRTHTQTLWSFSIFSVCNIKHFFPPRSVFLVLTFVLVFMYFWTFQIFLYLPDRLTVTPFWPYFCLSVRILIKIKLMLTCTYLWFMTEIPLLVTPCLSH